MDIIIRKVVPEDAHDYAACHISCWLSAYKGIVSKEFLENIPSELEQREERYRKAFIEPGDCEYYCVIKAERMIGFLFFGKSTDNDKLLAGDVIAIYLLEEFWSKGYGKQMMDFAVEKLKSNGHNEIILWTFKDNERAKRFYEKYGFTYNGKEKEMTNWGGPLTVVRYELIV